MKKPYLILPLALLLCFTVGCQDKAVIAELEKQSEGVISKAKKEVEEVLRMTESAVLNSDMEAFGDLWATDYILTNRSGKIRTKSDRIAILKSGELDYLDIQRTDTEIRISGDTAIVTGQTKVKIKRQGREFDLLPARFTSTFIKRDGRWQLFARHACEIEQ